MAKMEEMLKEMEELKAKLAAAQAESAALKAQRVTLKVSELGAISVYGLGRFPVTLYAEQMKKFIALVPTLVKFMEDNQGKLSTGKDDPKFAAIRLARKERDERE